MHINETYKKARNNDPGAEKQLFEDLSARFRLLVRRKVTNNQDCEEIVQDAMMSVFQNYRKASIDISFAAWAHRILENKTIDFYRKKKRNREQTSELLETGEMAGSFDPDPAFRMKLIECLRKVHSVNTRAAEILKLSYRGHKSDDICERMSLKRNTAYSVLSRARTLLSKCLKTGDIR